MRDLLVLPAFLFIFNTQTLIMDQRIIDLYNKYTHQPFSRDEFLKRLAATTGSMALVFSVIPLLKSNNANIALHAWKRTPDFLEANPKW